MKRSDFQVQIEADRARKDRENQRTLKKAADHPTIPSEREMLPDWWSIAIRALPSSFPPIFLRDYNKLATESELDTIETLQVLDRDREEESDGGGRVRDAEKMREERGRDGEANRGVMRCHWGGGQFPFLYARGTENHVSFRNEANVRYKLHVF